MLIFEKILTDVQKITQEKAKSIELKETVARQAISILKKVKPHDFDNINFSRFSYFVGTPMGKPTEKMAAENNFKEYIAIAADGSEIPIDSDFFFLYYVINVGIIAIKYGKDAFFSADSIPEIFYKDNDLYEEVEGRKLLVKGELLESKMLLKESIALSEAIEEFYNENVPLVSLIDGTLIQWEIKSRSDSFKRMFIEKFESLFKKSKELNSPVAGYISGSHSKDVVGLVKIAALLKEKWSETDIEKFNILEDTDIFARLLKRGERSALFKSNIPILSFYNEPIYFFYLNVGPEVARIELPSFVAKNESKISLLHELILNQAEKGKGYPVVLREAHEQAVIKNSEKMALQEMFIEQLAQKGIIFNENYKLLFKKIRGI
jgi:hypothetical protein